MIMTFGFVILHYMNMEITMECVDRISKIKLDENQIKIVIVDNASPNGSGDVIKEKMKQKHNVFVILSKKNLGFASGNNLGYSFLKQKFEIDFAIVLNNDVLIEDHYFLDKIKGEFLESTFDVLGPDIISLTSSEHQNPAHEKEFTIQDLKKIKRKNNNFIKYHFFYRIRSAVKYFFGNILGYKKKSKFVKRNYKERKVNVVLHGSCYILSRNFINENEMLFYDKTFMYFEEDIFFFNCSKKGYKLVYSPKIEVFHVEDVATRDSQKNIGTLKLNKIRLMNDSIDELIRLKTEGKNENKKRIKENKKVFKG